MNQQADNAWGVHALQIELPAASVRLTGLSAKQRAALSSAYSGFITNSPNGIDQYSIVCNAYRLNGAPTESPEALTQAGQYAPLKIRWADGIDLMGVNFEARIGLGSPPGLSSLGTAEEHELAYANVIENFLRVFIAHCALRQNGVILHSAGLVFDGQAYIFSGRSNAGKTTLTRKAHKNGAWVLSDDINLVLPHEQGYRAHAVPFTGEFGRTLQHEGGQKSYPVAGIVLLEQADTLETSPVPPSTAVARLLTGCPFVNTDPEESATLFDVLTGLVAKVPVIRLRSRRDDDIEAIMTKVKGEFNHA
jgi:hypothetical protein